MHQLSKASWSCPDAGTISAGKYADIIAVRGDVLRYINLLQDVDLVMKRGGEV
ncbi:hypothetical protein L0337_22235 [candidate division KSB1 bacterium]|nr:hypothetical protein [candidate division KSB1 bacterium]